MDINNDNKKMKKRKTICLNMIVKNEENVIKETLENLCFYIKLYFKFAYYIYPNTTRKGCVISKISNYGQI